MKILTRVRGLLAALTAALGLLVASCGGGGGAPAAGTTYASVAMAGELIDYTVDPVDLTYSYTIVESQYGLTGKTGSGTLTRNADGTYTPSGVPNARIAILPNGLLVGAVRESLGPSIGVVTIPIIGLANPVTNGAAMNGTYNYLHRGCLLPVCATDTGTFVITASPTSVAWSSCPDVNLAAGSCASGGRSGTMTHLGGGRWQVMEGSANVGTAIVFASGGQNVLIVDLKDRRAGGLGIGLVVGAQQATMTRAQTDGTWVAGTSTGHWAVFNTVDTQISVTVVDGFVLPTPVTSSFTMNSPWTGMATAVGGGKGFLAGSGVYVLETGSGHAELGIKIR